MAFAKKATPAGKHEVDEFMRTLVHPLKAELGMVRALILAADPAIDEGIKWKAPSFHIGEHFATANVRDRDAVQIILHLGARKTEASTAGMTIVDPTGLLQWLAKDRASVKFRDKKELKAKGAAFQEIIRLWIRHLP